LAFSPDGKAPRLGQRRQDGPPLGRPVRKTDRRLRGARRLGEVPWRSARTARPSPRRAGTRPSGCGTWRPGKSWHYSEGTQERRAGRGVQARTARPLASRATNKTVRLWDVEAGKETATLLGHAYYVRSVAFSPDGQGRWPRGATTKPCGCGTCARARSWPPWRRTPVGCSRVTFSPDGAVLAEADADNVIRLWDVSPAK